jgi:hypothetical protein
MGVPPADVTELINETVTVYLNQKQAAEALVRDPAFASRGAEVLQVLGANPALAAFAQTHPREALTTAYRMLQDADQPNTPQLDEHGKVAHNPAMYSPDPSEAGMARDQWGMQRLRQTIRHPDIDELERQPW